MASPERLTLSGTMNETDELLLTVFSNVATKAVGSAWRIRDDRNAPNDVKRATIVRELSILGQIGLYSTVTKVGVVNPLKKLLLQSETPQLKALGKLIASTRGTLMMLTGLGVLSNYIAESTSRKFAPRDTIWEKPHQKESEDVKEKGSVGKHLDTTIESLWSGEFGRSTTQPVFNTPSLSSPAMAKQIPVFANQPFRNTTRYPVNF
jgi:hypothetical protein